MTTRESTEFWARYCIGTRFIRSSRVNINTIVIPLLSVFSEETDKQSRWYILQRKSFGAKLQKFQVVVKC